MPNPSTAPATARHDGAEAPASLSRAERSSRTAELLALAADATDEAERSHLLEQVILINCGVAQAIASRYRGRGVSREDLDQAAYEGLVKAVLRFDPGLDHDLLTYAVPTIRGEVQRYFRDHGWSVRPPRRVQELQWRMNHVTEELGQELGREPERHEVVARLGVDESDYDEAVQAFGCFQPASLDRPATAGSPSTIGDLIPGDDKEFDVTDARVTLAPVVRQLSARDRRILYLRFFENRTQEEIGQDLGVTQMQVSRLLARILGRLRAEVA